MKRGLMIVFSLIVLLLASSVQATSHSTTTNANLPTTLPADGSVVDVGKVNGGAGACVSGFSVGATAGSGVPGVGPFSSDKDGVVNFYVVPDQPIGAPLIGSGSLPVSAGTASSGNFNFDPPVCSGNGGFTIRAGGKSYPPSPTYPAGSSTRGATLSPTVGTTYVQIIVQFGPSGGTQSTGSSSLTNYGSSVNANAVLSGNWQISAGSLLTATWTVTGSQGQVFSVSATGSAMPTSTPNVYTFAISGTSVELTGAWGSSAQIGPLAINRYDGIIVQENGKYHFALGLNGKPSFVIPSSSKMAIVSDGFTLYSEGERIGGLSVIDPTIAVAKPQAVKLPVSIPQTPKYRQAITRYRSPYGYDSALAGGAVYNSGYNRFTW